MKQNNLKKSVAVFMWFGDKILLSERLDVDNYSGYWSAPGGRADAEDVSLAHTAQREIKEETDMFLLREELMILDSYEHDGWRCFLFEAFKDDYLFKDIKNTEPKKHSPWKLFSIKETMKLKLMPSIREYLQEKLDKKTKKK